MESHNQWLFVTVVFHFASCLGSPELQLGSECHSCSWLSNVPLCVWTAFSPGRLFHCASGLPPPRLVVCGWACGLLPLWVHGHSCMSVCVDTHFYFSLVHPWGGGCGAAVLYGNFVFEALPDSLYGNCTTFRSISAVNRGQVSPRPHPRSSLPACCGVTDALEGVKGFPFTSQSQS